MITIALESISNMILAILFQFFFSTNHRYGVKSKTNKQMAPKNPGNNIIMLFAIKMKRNMIMAKNPNCNNTLLEINCLWWGFIKAIFYENKKIISQKQLFHKVIYMRVCIKNTIECRGICNSVICIFCGMFLNV